MTEHEELEVCRAMLARVLRPEHYPFICGHSERGAIKGMPVTIMVCPQEGSDITFLYDLRK